MKYSLSKSPLLFEDIHFRIHNPEVTGSTPVPATRYKKDALWRLFFYLDI